MSHSESVLFLLSPGIQITDLKAQDCVHIQVNTHIHTLLSRFTGSLEFSQLSGEDLWDVAITYLNYTGI